VFSSPSGERIKVRGYFYSSFPLFTPSFTFYFHFPLTLPSPQRGEEEKEWGTVNRYKVELHILIFVLKKL